MKSSSTVRLAPLTALLVPALTLVDLAPAQVPEGHAVVATCASSAFPGTPGLFVFPMSGGPTTQGTPITGLPPALSTAASTVQGAWAVSLRSSDGAILVTTASSPGASPTHGNVELYILHLTGNAVSRSQAILLGTSTSNAAMNHAQLPDGRILVVGSSNGAPVPQGPMAGHRIAIVDPSSPNPITGLPEPTSLPANHRRSGGVAIDPSGRFCYLLQSAGYHDNPPGGWSLLRQDLTPPYADCLIATAPNESAHGIACDDDSAVYVAASSSADMRTHVLHPNGCATLALTPAIANNGSIGAWGIDFDRASGSLIGTSVASSPQMGDLGRMYPATGLRSVIGVAPPGGWGLIGNQGVAVNNTIESYGPRSDGQSRYWFENFPNPGGQPTAGNLGFTVTLDTAPGTAIASAMALSFSRGSTSAFGAEILVDLSSTFTHFIPPAASLTFPLPIPNDASLSGLVLNAQSLHLEPGATLAASRGLTLTVQ